jgi:hypothetical protein
VTSPTFTSSPDDVSLSSGQAKFLYWFVGTVPILKAMTPISTHLGNLWVGLGNDAVDAAKHTGQPHLVSQAVLARAAKLYDQVISDVSRQTATCSLQLLSYFVVGDVIKASLKKYYATKAPAKQDPGVQQVITQVVPLLAQVLATIMSRGLGSSQLNKLMQQSNNGRHQEVPAPEKWRARVNHFINAHFRDVKTDVLKPGKAAVFATGGMIVYFGALVGLLYGLSTLLEKALPDSFKPKKGKAQPTAPKPDPVQPLPQSSTPQLLWQNTQNLPLAAMNPLPSNLMNPAPLTFSGRRPYPFS